MGISLYGGQSGWQRCRYAGLCSSKHRNSEVPPTINKVETHHRTKIPTDLTPEEIRVRVHVKVRSNLFNTYVYQTWTNDDHNARDRKGRVRVAQFG